MAKVVVGMSGGVDSSVAALLLRQAGHEVIGVTMQIWQETEDAGNGSGASEAVKDAERVAEALGIRHEVLDVRSEFRSAVVDYFVREYEEGRTPNPCVVCNRRIKWEALYERAKRIGAEYVATGHYALLRRLAGGRYAVVKAAAGKKDQTYALYDLTQEQLEHTLMPLGEYTKERVRQIAWEQGLPVARKPDSMEICFIPDHDYAGFIERYTGRHAAPGRFVSTSGETLGEHRGLIRYTVGQRKGLGLALGAPMFVKELRPAENEVVLAQEKELFSDTVYANRLNFMGLSELDGVLPVTAKIRYSHSGAEAELSMAGEDLVCCRFKEPQRAVTAGQALVWYDGEVCLGGGTIVTGSSASVIPQG